MIADHIPFIFSQADCRMLKTLYRDSVIARISLQTKDKTVCQIPQGIGLWVDGAVDGLHGWKPQRTTKEGKLTKRYEAYDEYIKTFPGHDRIGDAEFQRKPQNDVVKQFVEAILDLCRDLSPEPIWLSVPQLPMVSNASRNKINRLLAQSAAEWKRVRKYTGKLILPVIFTHSKQVNLRTLKKCELVLECFKHADAQGVWVVDSTMDDQEGSGSLEARFQGLIKFHQELSGLLPSDAIRIGGPYWGMNLILWSRGLIHNPAIGLGSAYRYRIPGPAPSPGKYRVALSPLRRQALASEKLDAWVAKALTTIPSGDAAHAELEDLSRNLRRLRLLPDAPKVQVAKFYKDWFNSLSSLPQNGRALALFQDLSKAFVLGRSLQPLPADEKTARRPERVAQQLMLNCL
jgi:hypothetical protein